MSIESITARILQEAKDEAEHLKKQAEAEKDTLLAKAAEEAEAVKKETAAKAVEDAKVLGERRNSVAELEARKLRLSAKQEMIDRSFEEAAAQLAGMPAAEYQAFLLGLVEPYRAEPGEILLNEKDHKAYGKALEEALKDSPLAVAEETVPIQGGMILRQGCVSLNASLEKLMETQKKQITAEIAGVLFS
ncbi:V-type ATP synthase subunit E family protein [Cuneatibacter sp. NSJ-177]|uniref:V-type ATP synthase subunit E n=1 Tax=Cuneatibacter sp. NSJ-177 TaxID=2931401 RepID=UPI001FD4D585|nr:V-type ATP synthase subunit E family protein [Cuneatibacter sp. NSJ-177]MCJ7835459.1 V-type ATP synthase subunit E family protein [Cuneatibacter sp. NSJ-177]